MKSVLAITPIIAVLAAVLSAPVKSAPDPGAREWLQCRACHTLKQGEAHKLGPNLAGIYGARAATRSGYDYSQALAKSDIVWDRATLDRWIEDPSQVLKGHKMVFIGQKNAAKRKVLIDYIAAHGGRARK